MTKTEIFIEKSKEVHSTTYGYQLVNYKSSKKKVKILCRNHGVFSQTPSGHLSGKGCKKCGQNKVAKNQSYNLSEFIDKAKKVHGGKYSYKYSKYKDSQTKIIIDCKIHGNFLQTPNKHLLGQGCRKCGYNSMQGVPKDLYKMMKKLKTAVSSIYKRQNYTEYSEIYHILGCDWNTFKTHLEGNEFGFKVGQEGLDLDHIVPISKANTGLELLDLSHYSNFQLLPSYYNRYIKKNKYFDIDNFREYQRGKTII